MVTQRQSIRKLMVNKFPSSTALAVTSRGAIFESASTAATESALPFLRRRLFDYQFAYSIFVVNYGDTNFLNLLLEYNRFDDVASLVNHSADILRLHSELIRQARKNVTRDGAPSKLLRS
jgi:hypothetical protein